MLNYTICRKCILTWRILKNSWYKDEEFDFNAQWKDGEIWCPGTNENECLERGWRVLYFNSCMILIKPPENCPYFLEHVVSVEVEKTSENN